MAAGASAQQPGGKVNTPETLASPGTGKFSPPHYFADPELPEHTLYQPKNIPAGSKMPLMVWGNGGCLKVGTIMAPFLLQIASQGVVVIANGGPEDPSKGSTYQSYGAYGRSSSKFLTTAIDWAEKNAGKGKWAHLDTSRIAAAGQSCGGGEAQGITSDPRVTVMGIFNSGGMGAKGTKTNKPHFYFLGGPKDMAYSGGNRDYAAIAAGTPAWKGNWPPAGHGGTFNDLNGGVYGVAGAHWVNYVLRGNESEAAWFNGGAAKDGWTEVASKSLDAYKPPSPL
ncbi:hypothetical protein BT63DRAFT_408496 [Microthyrium microscopicum]|uniref:Alpha/beta-hydrolase n=1 Tax=Microthyrium microscopicum TaxID=703497 RepID=A0A6A6UTN3_9PEZI|nr:hypothetical protein BT63DRAFT_408496 [Microthyrium microscopicum]